MEERSAQDLSEQRKRRFSSLLRRSRVLRFGLSVVARLMAPRQPVGAVGVVFDEQGRVLLVEHVFRTDFPWGLPGGWVERGEDPSHTVRREIQEELGLIVDVGPLLLSAQIGIADRSTHPPHLGLAYFCRLTGGSFRAAREVVSCTWAHPGEIRQDLAPFQRQAIVVAAEELSHRERVSAEPC